VRFVFAAILVLLPACVAAPPAGVAVLWNRVEEPHRVCESLSGRKQFFNVLGCAHWEAPKAPGGPRVCSIYAPEPRNEHDLQRFATIGHELMHCFDGNWHDRWGRMNGPTRNAAAESSAAAGGTSQAQE
jgi:hypothetical protein